MNRIKRSAASVLIVTQIFYTTGCISMMSSGSQPSAEMVPEAKPKLGAIEFGLNPVVKGGSLDLLPFLGGATLDYVVGGLTGGLGYLALSGKLSTTGGGSSSDVSMGQIAAIVGFAGLFLADLLTATSNANTRKQEAISNIQRSFNTSGMLIKLEYKDTDGDDKVSTAPLTLGTDGRIQATLPIDYSRMTLPVHLKMLDSNYNIAKSVEISSIPPELLSVLASGQVPASKRANVTTQGAMETVQSSPVIAESGHLNSVDVDLPPVRRVKNPHAVAVVVGIEDYGDSSPVPYAKRDAQVFKKYLVNTLGVTPENILVLTDSKATLSRLRQSLSSFLGQNVRPDSEVFFYYSGHGVSSWRSGVQALMPWDGDPTDPEATCFPLHELYRSLGRLKSRSTTVFLDSCFSGLARSLGRTSILRGARPMQVADKPTAVPRNITVFAATKGNEVSYPFDKKRHGVFTYHLLKGLMGNADSNGDGNVTIDELQRYVRSEVSKTAHRLSKQQTPELITNDPNRVLVSK